MNGESLMLGLERGFVDSTVPANNEQIPQFISNDPSRGEKVITSIREEMRNCESFMFSVAFITYDGVNALLEEFRYLRDHNIRGRILTSQYQNFTDPKAIRKLCSLGNIEIRIVTEEQMKMHSKCYIFSRKGTYDVIIGSSNLTNNALCSNGEWNVRFNSLATGEVVRDIIDEFEKVFDHATPITDPWLKGYEEIYGMHKWTFRTPPDEPVRKDEVTPNRMQVEALRGIQDIRNSGGDRALIISATGSGKTYLSAFDAKVYGGRFLYLVHRRPILNKSFESFRKVLGPDATMVKFDASERLPDVDYVFATIQTMSRYEVYSRIPKDRFDYIMIDEVHHIGAATYQRITSYFEPKFLAGMTATPDRTDGFDIYGFFNHNIAYEIRLKQAMEYNLTCPFHYFGISDITVDGESLDDVSQFSNIEFEKRVDYVVENAEFYGYGGDRLRGLVFCRGLKEAEMFAAAFRRRGYRAEWVSGEMDKETVETYIERLEGDGEYSLDYIFTADLFNEGVDIPSVNQVIMLRPTESPIVYIQQLGRGLRINSTKDFVTVLDFIGNYDKNYNIPIALSDDRSYNKSEARRFVAAGDSMVYGNSTISFDEVSKAKIYESIDRARFSDNAMLMESYRNLKAKLGRIPKPIDFRRHGSMDAMIILSKYKSYHRFLAVKEKDYHTTFSPGAESMLDYITKIIAPGKRALEIEVLRMLMGPDVGSVKETLRERHPELDANAMDNILAVFDGTFYNNDIRLIENDRVSGSFRRMMAEEGFVEEVGDIIDMGLDNNGSYSPRYRNTDFVLYRMYTYDDVCRLMNWGSNVNAQNIGGYKYDTKTNTFSIFINYVKGEEVVESQRYEDHFENRSTLIAFSKSTENKDAKNMVRVRDHVANGTRIHLFVRKNKDDEGSKEFYYLGELEFMSFLDNGKPVKIRYRLKDEIRADLFDYFNS